jgi:hypothetical protein
MKNFLPFIILILIAALFGILAVYTSTVIEGNTNKLQKQDCVYEWDTWGNCVDLKKTRDMIITTPAKNGGTACPSKLTEERFCSSSAPNPPINSNTDCTRPSDVTGYEFSGETFSKSNFKIDGLKCAEGYYGSPEAVACNNPSNPYNLKGCNKITIEVETSNPRLLVVNFTTDLIIKNVDELKNNFKYKVVSVDESYQSVNRAIVTSPTQIKLKTDTNIKVGQTVLVKYKQHKPTENGGAEMKIGDVKIDEINQMSVINNLVDNIPPKVRVAVVEHHSPQKLKLLFDEPIKRNSSFDINNFKISINGATSRTPNSVRIDNDKLILTLRIKVTKGQTVKFEYTKDEHDSSKRIADLNNNYLLDIQEITVLNNVGFPNRDRSSLSDYSTLKDIEYIEFDETDTINDRQRSYYGNDDEAYFNEQYVKSMGAHNPFNYINDLNNIDCRIDPTNRNRAICNLGRNMPLRQYNINELRDNRGDDDKDKYILKTKIVPVVTPSCPTCFDDADAQEQHDPGLKLNKSLSKLFDVEENIQLDKYDRTTKKNPNLQFNNNIKKLVKDVNKEIPNLNKDVSRGIKTGLNKMVPEIINHEMITPQSSSPQFNMPQINTPLFKNSVNVPKMTSSMKTPTLNTDVTSLLDKTMDTVSKAADTVNIDTRALAHNKPTQLIHEISHIKSNGRSNGFIPMLTSFSAF